MSFVTLAFAHKPLSLQKSQVLADYIGMVVMIMQRTWRFKRSLKPLPRRTLFYCPRNLLTIPPTLPPPPRVSECLTALPHATDRQYLTSPHQCSAFLPCFIHCSSILLRTFSATCMSLLGRTLSATRACTVYRSPFLLYVHAVMTTAAKRRRKSCPDGATPVADSLKAFQEMFLMSPAGAPPTQTSGGTKEVSWARHEEPSAHPAASPSDMTARRMARCLSDPNVVVEQDEGGSKLGAELRWRKRVEPGSGQATRTYFARMAHTILLSVCSWMYLTGIPQSPLYVTTRQQGELERDTMMLLQSTLLTCGPLVLVNQMLWVHIS